MCVDDYWILIFVVFLMLLMSRFVMLKFGDVLCGVKFGDLLICVFVWFDGFGVGVRGVG